MSVVHYYPQRCVIKGGRLGLYYKFRDNKRTQWVHKPFSCMANVRLSAAHQVAPPYFKAGFVYDGKDASLCAVLRYEDGRLVSKTREDTDELSWQIWSIRAGNYADKVTFDWEEQEK